VTEKLKIGKIAGAFGVRGEVKLFHFSGERERIAEIKELYLRETHRYGVQSIRYSGKTPILKLEGVSERSAAETLYGADVYVSPESLTPLDSDSYYVEDLIGMSVIGTDGAYIGIITDVIDNPAHDILTIARGGDGPAAEFFLPLADVFVHGIDSAARVVTVDLPEGLME